MNLAIESGKILNVAFLSIKDRSVMPKSANTSDEIFLFTGKYLFLYSLNKIITVFSILWHIVCSQPRVSIDRTIAKSSD